MRFHSGPALILLASAGLLANGCGNAVSHKLAGTWELQASGPAGSTTKESDPGGETNEPLVDTQSLYDGVAGGDDSMGTMLLVFHSNGSLETITDFPSAKSQKFWRWSTVAWDEDSKTAVVRCQMAPESVETAIHFVDPDTIELVPPNIDVLQTRLRFVRK